MTTSSDGITLLGSEMLTWSDVHGEAGAFGGLIAPHLLRGFMGAPDRVLVAGPVTPAVISGVAAGFAHTDVLTRSWPDAQELRDQLPADVSVFCGPLDRMVRPDEGYDAVVAVAGIDRLHSAEEETPTWQDVIGHLAGLLHERGELYVAVGNPVGVDRLVALNPLNRQHDAAWPQGHARVEEPADTAEVLAHLSERHALDEVETWVCHGPRSDPRAAASRAVLADRCADGVVLSAVRRAYDAPPPGGGDLHDPGRAAAELVRSGLGVSTAPLSVLHVRRSGRPDLDDAVVLLTQEGGPEGDVPVACRLERVDGAWHRVALVPTASYQVAPGLTRDLSRLDGPLREGEVLADRMLDLLAQHDASQAGVHVRQLSAWLGPEPGAVVDPARVPVLLERLVASDDELHLVDAGFVATEPAGRDTVLVRALLRFAAALLSTGARHPWSPASTPRALATSLAAAADVEVDDDLFDAAAALDRALHAPGQSEPAYEEPRGGAPIAAMSYAELVELAESLAVRAAEQDEHVVWLLKTVQIRQRRVRKARGNLRELTESREYRLGRRIFWLRDVRRRRQDAREEAEQPTGVWRDRSQEAEENTDPTVYVEQDLVPPGYRPHEGVQITPTGVDPGADEEG